MPKDPKEMATSQADVGMSATAPLNGKYGGLPG